MSRVIALVVAGLLPSARALSSGFGGRLDDPCECLNWMQVYKRNGAPCGVGHELSFVIKTGIIPWLARLMYGEEVCYNFFHRIDDNSCVNIVHTNEPGEWYSGQWCYVSKDCPDSSPVNGSGFVRTKLCTPGKDPMLRDKSPQELHRWAMENNLNMGLAVKMAYPVELEARWPLVKAFFSNSSEVALSSVNASVATKFRSLQESGKPFVLDSDNQRAPFGVMKGQKAFLIEKDPDNSVKGQPMSFTSWKCIQGCDA